MALGDREGYIISRLKKTDVDDVVDDDGDDDDDDDDDDPIFLMGE